MSELVIGDSTTELTGEYTARRELGEELPVALSLSMLADSAGVSYLINLIDLRARKGLKSASAWSLRPRLMPSCWWITKAALLWSIGRLSRCSAIPVIFVVAACGSAVAE